GPRLLPRLIVRTHRRLVASQPPSGWAPTGPSGPALRAGGPDARDPGPV
ncbi:MAG: hypothetical protein AVDCRST_MAG01-01-5185, partial [uncultured Rubrobacteraceae bacterium]